MIYQQQILFIIDLCSESYSVFAYPSEDGHITTETWSGILSYIIYN
jgi:hypothetical protein